jgi:hypothetical protein
LCRLKRQSVLTDNDNGATVKYLKCALCIVILCIMYGFFRTHFPWTAAPSTRTSETGNAQADDSDSVLQNESRPEDKDFIEKWSQSHPQNQQAQEEDPFTAGQPDYFHSDQPDYFGHGQQRPATEDHWGMDKSKSIGH